ncbi:MAG: dephospho-CoA kinase [Muribaculaceae bacterium]|nr:dephospho-CoA kinase [Muribaculaceae bacterium]
MSKCVTAVCGGIGSGKSVVCNVLRTMGYPVYDCDSEARSIMDADECILDEIARQISPECVTEGIIDRRRLSEIVFANADKLTILNSIVHSAVKRHLSEWITRQEADRVFVETAILYQSGLDRMVDEVWEVVAPKDVRIGRVMLRNGLTESQVEARIQSQDSFRPDKVHGNVHIITNDGTHPLLPRVEKLLRACPIIYVNAQAVSH